MAARVVWSPDGVDDLEQIVRFIARNSILYGRQVASDVVEAVERVSLFPRSGRIVPEFDDPNVRDMLVFNYRVIYRVHDDVVHIAAVVHGARDLRNALGSRKV